MTTSISLRFGFLRAAVTVAVLLLGLGLVLLPKLETSGLTLAAAEVQKEGNTQEKMWVYIGTYTRGTKSKGIYRLDYDPATGKLSEPVLVAETVDPSFLAIHPNGKLFYAVNEINEFNKKTNNGAISAFALDPKTGKLKFLNQKESKGGVPCHIVVDAQGKHVLAANYIGGSACVYNLLKDGQLGEMTGFVQHTGSGPNPKRQEKPHAHSINLDKANTFAFVADLGLDKVLIYKFDKTKGTLTDHGSVSVPAGGGPRHFSFHPNGQFAYAINELGNTVTAMTYDVKEGKLTAIQSITTLPKDFTKPSYTAEVQVHPSGKFLYGSNRGHNSIAMFRIDPKTGKLTNLGQQAEGIKTPRNFSIDPAGKFLIVANQDADSLVVFRIDQKTGELQSTGMTVSVPRPVCVRFFSPK